MIPNDDLGYGPHVEEPGVLVLDAADPADARLEPHERLAIERAACAVRALECASCKLRLLLDRGSYEVLHEGSCMSGRLYRRAFGAAMQREGSVRSQRLLHCVPQHAKTIAIGPWLTPEAEALLRIVVAIEGLGVDREGSELTPQLVERLSTASPTHDEEALERSKHELIDGLFGLAMGHGTIALRDLDLRGLVCEAIRRGLRLQLVAGRLWAAPHQDNEPALVQRLREAESAIVGYLRFLRCEVLDAYGSPSERERTAQYLLEHDDSPLRSFDRLVCHGRGDNGEL